ncbi:MAG: HAMP domain-containing protein, partial [Proteobacteria bacterium]|nr:HAMP domain-containing protein [Pseudomonadota bacterium]
MSKDLTVSIRDSIATHLMKVVFGLYFIVAISVTITHMVAEYYHTKDNVFLELKQFQKTFQQGIADGLWNVQSNAVEAMLAGMLTVPSIVGVKLENDEGIVIASGGKVLDVDGRKHNLELAVDLKAKEEELLLNGNRLSRQKDGIADLFGHAFPIVYEDADQRIGTATIYSSSGIVFDKVQYGFVFLVVNSLIKTTALWIIFLWFSRRLLRRPLTKLTQSAERLNMDNLDGFKVEVETSGRNELKVLEETFNSMVGKLSTARKKLQDYTGELEYMKGNLEQLVEERTSELAEAYEEASRA